jgi:hypothetical protein
MSAHATRVERSMMPLRGPWTAILLLSFLVSFWVVAVGVLTKQLRSGDYGPRTVVADDVAAAGMDHDAAGVALVTPGLPLEALGQALWALLEELLKQAVDQPGHLVVAGLPIVLSRYLTGVPWYGWPVLPLLAYREWLQWPSSRWWDPPLDWTFLALGAILATWALGALPGHAPPAPRRNQPADRAA